MRRLLAAIGFSFLAVNFFAAYWPSAAYGLSAAVCVVGGLAVIFIRKRFLKKSALCYAAVFFLCGAVALMHRMAYEQLVVKPVQALAGTQAVIMAEIEEVSQTQEMSYAFVRAKVTRIDGNKVSPFSVRFGLPGKYEQGDVLTAEVVFEMPEADRYLLYHYANGVYLSASVIDPNAILCIPGEAGAWQRWKEKSIEAVQSLLPGENTSLIAAMTIGDDSLLSKQTEEDMRKAGLSHLLVVSGLHLSAVSGMLYESVRGWLSKKSALLAACGGSLLFMALVGLSPSVVRAGVTMLLFYAAKWMGEKEDSLTSLGFAALLLCLFNPYAASDVGLLLSFSATLGVLTADILWRQWILEKETTPSWLRQIGQMTMISVGAVLATAPVLIWFDMGLSLYGAAANLLIAPLVLPMMASAFMTVLFAGLPFLGIVAYPVAFFCGLCLKWLQWVAHTTAMLPASTLMLSGLYPAVAVIGLFVVAWAAYQNEVSFPKAFCMTALLASAACAVFLWQTSGVIRVVFAGSAENAPLVVLAPDATAVVFRGGESGIAEVRQVLKEHQRNDIQLLIDLRKEPEQFPLREALESETIFTVETDCFQRAVLSSEIEGLDFYVLRQENGCAAILSCGGGYAAVTSGAMDFEYMPEIQVFFAGSGKIEHLKADTILFAASPREHWQSVSAQQTIKSEETELWLHPKRGWSIKEENSGAV